MADDRRHASLPYPLARVTGLALALVLTVVDAQGAEEYQRLSAREIRAQIIGNVVTDEAHWSQHFRPDGTLHAIVVSQRRQGTWTIKGYTLCLTLKTRQQDTTTECYEVWRWEGSRGVSGQRCDGYDRVPTEGTTLTASDRPQAYRGARRRTHAPQ